MFPTFISNIKSIYLNYYLSAEEISLYLFDLREIRCFHSERQWRKLAYLQNCTIYEKPTQSYFPCLTRVI